MNYKQKEPRKRKLFYSIFFIALIFSYGLYHYPLPPVVAADQTNPVSAHPQLLKEQPQIVNNPSKHPAKQTQVFHKQLNVSNKQQQTFNKQPKNPAAQSQKLNEVIALIYKTAIGRELAPFINELLGQNNIQLTDLENGHYGESGEGCVVKDGQFYYEGFFMLLSNKLSIEEAASALVHEVTHFLMIQKNIASSNKLQQEVLFFEISAFAVQHQFMTELQQLNLADPQTMFIGETQTVLEIMQNAYDYKKTASPISYDMVLEQLVAYGYPLEELNRLVSSRSEKECIGASSLT